MPAHKHLFPSPKLEFPKTLHEEKHKLAKAQVPVVTISATFKDSIARRTGEKNYISQEVVFSRAHYSMAVAILVEAQRRKKTTWLVDPTNYISRDDWKRILLIEKIGKLTARIKILKKLKEFVDTYVRSKFPLSTAIYEPLLYVTRLTKKTIVSLHYEAGNILAENDRRVLQVVTDPHVHDTYLSKAERENITFAVFDQNTQKTFLEKAKKMGKNIDEKRVIVTGPPIDPRIVAGRLGKNLNKISNRNLRLVITTSGLGSNKGEIENILEKILPNLTALKVELFLHAGTHKDFYDMFLSIAQKYGISIGKVTEKAQVRVNYEESIIETNQNLIDYAFPWADGFVTKPSGDMAYDGAASGCFLLLLEPWGVWEENVEKVFSNLGIAKKADVNNFDEQLVKLRENGWLEKARNNVLKIDSLFLEGAKKIVDLQQKLT